MHMQNTHVQPESIWRAHIFSKAAKSSKCLSTIIIHYSTGSSSFSKLTHILILQNPLKWQDLTQKLITWSCRRLNLIRLTVLSQLINVFFIFHLCLLISWLFRVFLTVKITESILYYMFVGLVHTSHVLSSLWEKKILPKSEKFLFSIFWFHHSALCLCNNLLEHCCFSVNTQRDIFTYSQSNDLILSCMCSPGHQKTINNLLSR